MPQKGKCMRGQLGESTFFSFTLDKTEPSSSLCPGIGRRERVSRRNKYCRPFNHSCKPSKVTVLKGLLTQDLEKWVRKAFLSSVFHHTLYLFSPSQFLYSSPIVELSFRSVFSNIEKGMSFALVQNRIDDCLRLNKNQYKYTNCLASVLLSAIKMRKASL